MRQINVIYCQLDSGGEEQRQTRQGLCFPLSSAALCPSHQIPTPPPGQQGSCDRSKTAPLHSSCLLRIPPALAWLSPMGCSPSGKQKFLKAWVLHRLWFLQDSPPASVWVPPPILCLCVGYFFHPLPLLFTADFSGAILF